MSLVWDNFKVGGSPKLVMLAMADWCNDAGGSLHPSIAAISRKVCVSEKQARRIVHELIEQNYLSVVGNENGGNPRSSRQYVLNIEKLSTTPVDVTTPASVTPPMQGHQPLPPVSLTPPADAPYPSHGREPNHQEPPRTIIRTTNTPASMLAAFGVTDSVAADWIKLRDRKKAAITQTALDGIHREAKKAGVSMDDAIRVCCERGWAGFKADWVSEKSGQKRTASPENFHDRDYGEGVTKL